MEHTGNSISTDKKRTYCEHLHQQLLLLLLLLPLTRLICLVAAGRQEAEVIMEEHRAPVLLL